MGRVVRTVSALVVVGLGLVASPAVAARDHAAARDDDVVICARTAKTVTDGLDAFVVKMEEVSKRALERDLTGAQDAVKQAGKTLSDVAPKLRADAAKAETPKLKDTINRLADEFDRLGTSLRDLSSLDKFDTKQLDGLAATMRDLCGTTPGPPLTPTLPGAPTPSPSPTPTAFR